MKRIVKEIGSILALLGIAELVLNIFRVIGFLASGDVNHGVVLDISLPDVTFYDRGGPFLILPKIFFSTFTSTGEFLPFPLGGIILVVISMGILFIATMMAGFNSPGMRKTIGRWIRILIPAYWGFVFIYEISQWVQGYHLVHSYSPF